MRTKNRIVIFLFLLSFQCFSQKIITTEYDWSPSPIWNDKDFENNKESYIYLKNYVLLDYKRGSDDVNYVFKTYHYIVYLADDNAVDNFNKVYIPFNNGIDIINIKARTFNKDGKVILFDKKNIKDAENLEDKGRFKLFAMDGVEKGNIVEVFYTIKKTADYYGLYVLQKTVTSKDVFIQISSPKNLHFALKEQNGKGINCDSVVNSKRYTSIYYDSIPSLKQEKYSDYEASRLRVDYKIKYNDLLNKSEIYTYESAAQSIYEEYYKEWDNSKKKMKKIINELKIDGLSTDEKILKIENFIKNNYVLKKFPGVEDANTLDFLLKNKASEETGIVKLFAMLFKAADIEHQLCITTSRNNMILDPDFMSWIYFDSFLFYFPQTGKYLAPSDYEYRYPMFPFMLMNNKCMHIKTISIGDITTALPEIKELPVTKSEENYSNIEATVHFDKDLQNTLVEMKQTFLGYNAIFIQPYYKFLDESKQKEFVTEFQKSISQDAIIKKYSVTNCNTDIPPLKYPFTIDASLSISSLTEQAGDNILFKIGLLIGEQSQLYEEEKRHLDVDMNFPHHLYRTITIDIPEGYKVKGLENTVFLFKGNGMFFESKNRIEGNSIIIEVKEEYDRLIYPLSDFETLKKVINAAADFNKSVIIFEKIK
jgi:hypothetical protein